MALSVEEKYIRKAEFGLNVKFPNSYVKKLLKQNGGELETEDDVWIFFPVFDDSDRERISRTANHLIRENEIAKKWSGFPANGLAIASNGSGDLMLYIIEDKREIMDAVYLWLHETEEIKQLANSIDDRIK